MNQSSVALPKRLLRIKRQTARLAELRCIRAAAQLEQAVQAEQASRASVDAAAREFRDRCRNLRMIEEVHASRNQIQRLESRLNDCLKALASARTEYDDAVKDRAKADGEVEVLERLLERRLEEIHHKAEQRKQQFADEWTLRNWNGPEAGRQEVSQ